MADIWSVFRVLSLGLILIIAHLFIGINPDVVFGEGDGSGYAEMVQWYLLMTVVAMALTARSGGLETFKTGVLEARGLPLLILGTILFWIIGWMARSIATGVLVPAEIAVETGTLAILYIAVVATSEEYFFRNFLQTLPGKKIEGPPFYAWIVFVNVLFALFHLGVSDGSLGYMGLMFTLGMTWSIIAKKSGLAGAIGCHAGWNIAVVGG